MKPQEMKDDTHLILLWRIAEELELANELKRAELELANPEWAKSGRTPGSKSSKLVNMSVGNPEEWSERYRQRQAELALIRSGL